MLIEARKARARDDEGAQPTMTKNNPTRDELIATYGLTVDDDGKLRIPTITEALRLWDDSMRAALDAMRHYTDTEFFSDDDTDYINAIADQISFLTEARIFDTNEEMIAHLELALNMTNEESSGKYPISGFQLGYADHYSPLSDLAKMNEED